MEELLRQHSPKITPKLSGDEIQKIHQQKKKVPKEPEDELDLHNGNFVKENLKITEDFIFECKRKRLRKIRIITGKGLSSPNLKARLKPAVENLLEDLQQEKRIEKYINGNGYFDVILIAK